MRQVRGGDLLQVRYYLQPRNYQYRGHGASPQQAVPAGGLARTQEAVRRPRHGRRRGGEGPGAGGCPGHRGGGADHQGPGRAHPQLGGLLRGCGRGHQAAAEASQQPP